MALSRKGDCKMKKFWILTCLIACIFGMTACGSEKKLTEYEQAKVDGACYYAENQYIPAIRTIIEQTGDNGLSDYTAEEVEYLLTQMYGFEANGNAFVSAMDSFKAAEKEIGGIVDVGHGADGSVTSAVIDDDQIIVSVPVTGNNNDAIAEVVVSNDRFFRLESASLNKVSTMSDSMSKAAMNTLLGMGSVFIVLILISLIISCFNVIPKIQKAFAKQEEDTTVPTAVGIEKAVAQIAEQEESDDLELVAVIAAAIAASEGATSTDGFVVRSIKRRKAF